MDTVPLDMDDIFGENDGVGDDDDGFDIARLPDLEDELEPMRDMREDGNEENEPDDETDNAELLAKLKGMKGASKNITKRSMPKLDATRLTGDRGIPIIPRTFERITLKGKNHEAEDLKVIMHTLQHWGHRLFPKMTFDEVLERVERLGAKKEVKTCLKKIRLDMPVLASDMMSDDEDTVQRAGGVDGTVQRSGSDDENAVQQGGSDDEDLVRRTGHSQQGAHNRDDQYHSSNEISDDELEDLIRDQGQPVTAQAAPASAQKASPKQNDQALSDEVRKKIAENKRKAMERRAAKLAQSNGDTGTVNDSLTSNGLKDSSGTSSSAILHRKENEATHGEAVHNQEQSTSSLPRETLNQSLDERNSLSPACEKETGDMLLEDDTVSKGHSPDSKCTLKHSLKDVENSEKDGDRLEENMEVNVGTEINAS